MRVILRSKGDIKSKTLLIPLRQNYRFYFVFLLMNALDNILVDLTELHTHLSTSVTPHLLWELAHRQGIALWEKDYWSFIEKMQITWTVDFQKFHDYFDTIQMIQSSPMGVEASVHEAVWLSYRKSNITTLEIRINPMRRNKEGLFDLDRIIFNAIVWMRRAMMEYPVKAWLIIETDRRFTLEQTEIIFNKAIDFAGQWVIWVDVSWPNVDNFSVKDLAPHFLRARDAWLWLTFHTWEAQSPDEVREVMKYITPDRIGHGITTATDPKLMDELAKKWVVLEVCPTSNVCTELVDSYDDFYDMFQLFKKHGVLFTINADNPMLLQTNVKKEFQVLYDNNVLTLKDIKDCIKLARDSSFLHRL